MAVTRLGLDGGIQPSLQSLQGPQTVSIGLATEANAANSTIGAATDQVTRFGIYGGIAPEFPRQFDLKFPALLRAEETNIALAVTADNPAGEAVGQATTSGQAFPVSTQVGAAITSVVSSRGTDIIAANESLTVNVDDSTGITSVSVNGVGCSSVTIATGTSVTCNVPLGVGVAPGSSVDVIVNNGTPSAGFSVTFEPPFGMIYTQFTEDWNALDPDSPFSGDTDFSDITLGDYCIYDAVTTPDSNSVTMSGEGAFTLGGTITQIQTFDYYFYDVSTTDVSSTIEQITVYPGPVEVTVSQATEVDIAQAVSSISAITGLITQATEADTSIAVADGSTPQQEISQASETNAAQPVTGGNDIIVTVGFASETNTPFAFTDGSTPTAVIARAIESASAFPVTNAQAIVDSITIAAEVNTAQDVDFPPDLNSIRDQIEALTTIVIAMQAQINDIYIALDLDSSKPNTYQNSGAFIQNSEFNLTKTDNGNETFTVNRTDN